MVPDRPAQKTRLRLGHNQPISDFLLAMATLKNEFDAFDEKQLCPARARAYVHCMVDHSPPFGTQERDV